MSANCAQADPVQVWRAPSRVDEAKPLRHARWPPTSHQRQPGFRQQHRAKLATDPPAHSRSMSVLTAALAAGRKNRATFSLHGLNVYRPCDPANLAHPSARQLAKTPIEGQKTHAPQPAHCRAKPALAVLSAGNATYSCDMTGKRPAESVRAEDRNASSCSCLRQIGIQRC